MSVTAIKKATGEQMVALLDAAKARCDDVPQSSGLIVIYVDDCGCASTVGVVNLHQAEITAACFQIAMQQWIDME